MRFLVNPFTGEVVNAFCPTGEGGGKDPTCSPGGGVGGRTKVTKKQLKRLNIDRAAVLLKERGIELLGVKQPKLVEGKFVAQYEIEKDGVKKVVPVDELKAELLK
jgi:hypothetical protein